jgi:hypothetical protein
MKIEKIKLNPNNPRTIKGEKITKLIKSIQDFPEMMEKRPIVCVTDDDGKLYPLGGNMRLKAIQKIGMKEIPGSWIVLADDWTEEQRSEFVIKDNVSFGDWDWDALRTDWNVDDLEKWGLDVEELTETGKLSQLKFESIYYEPEHKPNIKLEDCINLEKFDAKIKALDEFDLTKKQKEILKFFVYRFIKIDFENVANYYFFNASDEEKKAIERLRLVLCDTGLNGFIEDHLIQTIETIEGWKND